MLKKLSFLGVNFSNKVYGLNLRSLLGLNASFEAFFA